MKYPRVVRKGERITMRAQTFGWIEKEAPYDGLLIQTPEGPELIPADVVIATYPQLVAAVKKRNGKK